MLPPFSFDQFLSVLQSYPYYSVVHYIKSFLKEFNKKEWTINDKIKIIKDFKSFILPKMLDIHAKNKTVSDPDLFFNEGLDKLVCTKLFDKLWQATGVDDKFKDEIFYKKCMLFKWVNLTALMDESIYSDIQSKLQIHENVENIKNITQHSLFSKYLALATTELIKINTYKAPRDKLVCILNAVYLLTHLMTKIKAPSHPDYLLPFVIYVIIQSKLSNMISNIQYIMRFRDLQGESDYYMVMMNSAVQYIDTLDDKQLNVSKEEFDDKLNKSLSEIDEEMTPKEQINNIPINVQPPKLKGLGLFLGKVVDVFNSPQQQDNFRTDVDDDLIEISDSPNSPNKSGYIADYTTERSSRVSTQFSADDKPEFLLKLTAQEQEQIEEDDLQLAMAISLSLKSGDESNTQEVKIPWFPEFEKTGGDIVLENPKILIEKNDNNYTITLEEEEQLLDMS